MNINFVMSRIKTMRVDQWLARKSKADLFFVRRETHLSVTPEGKLGLRESSTINDDVPPNNLDKAVLWALETSQHWGSIPKDSYLVETHSGKFRSVYDLWRHIKRYFPGLTIFDVMRSLYRTREKTGSHYCMTVKRRVFWLDRYHDDFHRNHRKDEFGLNFSEWKDIGL